MKSFKNLCDLDFKNPSFQKVFKNCNLLKCVVLHLFLYKLGKYGSALAVVFWLILALNFSYSVLRYVAEK